jgi:hypothetical protein
MGVSWWLLIARRNNLMPRKANITRPTSNIELRKTRNEKGKAAQRGIGVGLRETSGNDLSTIGVGVVNFAFVRLTPECIKAAKTLILLRFSVVNNFSDW